MGLLQIRQLYNLSLQELADKLQVSNQMVSMWERHKKPISKNKLKQLSELFNIPDYYFVEELDELDMLEVQSIKLKNAYKDTIVKVKNSDGTISEVEAKAMDKSTLADLRVNSFVKKKVQLLNMIEDYLLPTDITEDEDDLRSYISKSESKLYYDINIYQHITILLSSKKIPYSVIFSVIAALLYAYDIDINDIKLDKQLYDEKLLSNIYQILRGTIE